MLLVIELQEMKQQKVVEKICREIQDTAERQIDFKDFIDEVSHLVLTMAGNLRAGNSPFLNTRFNDGNPSPAESQARAAFSQVAEFTQNTSEAGLILWHVLENLLAASIGTFKTQWHSEVLRDPKATLGVDNISAEVSLPQELVA